MAKTRVVVVASPTFLEKIERQASLLQCLYEAQMDYMHTQDVVVVKNQELIEIKTEIGGYMKEGKILQLYRANHERASKRAESTGTALAEARKKSSALKEEIDSLERELADLRDGNGIGFEEVLSFQRDVESREAKVACIESFLAEQHRIRADAQARLQLPEDNRSMARANLAAQVVLGELDEQRLKEFDAETDKLQLAMDNLAAETLAEALPIAESADSAITGLERQLEAARRALSELEVKRPAILTMFLYSVAEVEGLRYLELVHELRDCYLKLSAIDKQLGNNVFLSPRHLNMYIPSFKLRSCQGQGSSNEEATLFSAQHADFYKAHEKLIEQLRATGIMI